MSIPPAPWISALAGIILLAPPCSADTYPRQPGVDVIHYAFRLTLRDETDEIEGNATVEAKFVKEGVAEFTLDLASPSSGKGMTVSAVTCGGKPAKYEHKDSRLHIALDPPAKAGEQRSFTVAYRGVPASGLRIGKNRHDERTFFSENWPDRARQWLPTVDHPSDKASSEFFVTAPVRYQVVSNGLLQEETDLGDGRRLTHWKQSVPIASWLNALGAAQFTSHRAGTVRGIPLESWVFHQDRDTAVPALEKAARRVLEFYTQQIGPYPYEKLAGVQAAGLGGGMELASAIFYGERNVSGRGIDRLVAHEVAHQWFGDSVTERDWDDIWLSEGFATYFALLFLEHDSGRDAFVAGLKRSREVVFATEQRNPRLAVLHDNLADTRQILSRLVYEKAGWVLHMLRFRLGTETFWAGIREYYRRHRDGNVSTDDFRRAMEEVSGEDLGWFFRQWLKQPGSPEVKGTWQYHPENRALELELKQVQSGDAYRLPIEVGITVDGSDQARIEKVELTNRIHRFRLSADQRPTSVTLDPNCWMLMKSSLAAGSVDAAVSPTVGRAAGNVASETAATPEIPTVSAPPKDLKLDPFYTKYVSAHGLPVVGSSKVSDHALREAAYLADQMLAHRPEVREAMIRNKVRLAVMAYSERTTDIPEHHDLTPKLYWNFRARGLGASRQRPAVSCAEENLLNYKGDPYSTENIMIHEFGHAIHSMGMRSVDPTFDPRLRAAYKDALAKRLWKGTYAASNASEYWAEGVQSWFDTNRQNDSSHNHVDTREELRTYDPALAKLVEEVMGDGPWRYIRPDHRKDIEKSHLAGYDPAKGPAFRWEPELVEARRKHNEDVRRRGDRQKADAAAKKKDPN
jgi:aminopeptidase N